MPTDTLYYSATEDTSEKFLKSVVFSGTRFPRHFLGQVARDTVIARYCNFLARDAFRGSGYISLSPIFLMMTINEKTQTFEKFRPNPNHVTR